MVMCYWYTHTLVLFLQVILVKYLQCFDAVGCATGKASIRPVKVLDSNNPKSLLFGTSLSWSNLTWITFGKVGRFNRNWVRERLVKLIKRNKRDKADDETRLYKSEECMNYCKMLLLCNQVCWFWINLMYIVSIYIFSG